MKVGLDIHGVIDLYPEFFAGLSRKLVLDGHEVHIITGQEWRKVRHKVKKFDISYTHHFSIVDYHKSIGTPMHKDDKDTWWMAEKIWVRSKGDYIHRTKIDVHFDDSYEYCNYCPDFCTFIVVPKTNFLTFNKMVSRELW